MEICEKLSILQHNEKETNKNKKKLKDSFDCLILFWRIITYNFSPNLGSS